MLTQTPSFRFLATGAIISLFVLTFLFFAHQSRDSTSHYILKAPRPDQSISECLTSTPQNGSDFWEFKVERDGQNHGLSDEQCQSAFPKLFVEIIKSADLRREARLSYKDLDSREVENGMVRAIIDRGEVSSRPNPRSIPQELTTWMTALHRRLWRNARNSLPSPCNPQLPPTRPLSLRR